MSLVETVGGALVSQTVIPASVMGCVAVTEAASLLTGNCGLNFADGTTLYSNYAGLHRRRIRDKGTMLIIGWKDGRKLERCPTYVEAAVCTTDDGLPRREQKVFPTLLQGIEASENLRSVQMHVHVGQVQVVSRWHGRGLLQGVVV